MASTRTTGRKGFLHLLRRQEADPEPGSFKAPGKASVFGNFDPALGYPSTGQIIRHPLQVLQIPTALRCVNLIENKIADTPLRVRFADGTIRENLPAFLKQLDPRDPMSETMRGIARSLILHGVAVLAATEYDDRGTRP